MIRWSPALAVGAGLTAILALTVALAFARAETPEAPLRLEVRPVPLDMEHPERRRVGALTYAGGLVLTAPGAKAFGGLSGIAVREDGRFLSQSDAGELVQGRIVLDAEGRLAGVADAAIARLIDVNGEPFAGPKGRADAEDITLLPGGGYAIAFEGMPRVLAYTGEGPPRRLGVPQAVWSLPPNAGVEALAAWTDAAGRQRLLEGTEDGRAWSCDLEGADCVQILDRRDAPNGFRLTGLDALPEGRGLVAVYRGFDLLHGFRAVIAWVRPDATPKVTVLARLAPPRTVDNMEGIAAVANPDGSVRLYLVSDDNFLALQRTLLLAFDWGSEPEPGRSDK